IVAATSASALAGMAVARIDGHADRRPRGALALGVALLLQLAVSGWPSPTPLAVPTGSDVPDVHRWLASHGEGDPVLEVPTGYDVAGMTAEARAAYFSVFHWSPMLNGVTGYPPAPSWLLKRYWVELPDPDALARLAGCTGLRWVVVHPGNAARDAAWDELPGLAARGPFRGLGATPDRLFEVLSRTPTACRDRLGQDAVTMDGNPVVRLERIDGSLRVDGVRPALEAGGETRAQIVLTNDGMVGWPATAESARARFAGESRGDGADTE